jgi:Cu2+-exporting ATPase/Cu+-exporting ATPase
MSEARLLELEPSPAAASAKPVAATCAHCGDQVPAAILRSTSGDGPRFCCDGCSAVWSLLRGLKLDEGYYGLKAGKKSPLKPVLETGEDYSALDGPKFRDPAAERPSIDFFLEGIHCSACVWILERLPELSPEIESARLDMGRSLLRVRAAPGGRFETAALLLLKLGYRPHPMVSEPELEERIRREDRKTLRRIGISAFSAMNVMIWSVSLYTGVDGREGELFRWLSIATSIPALGYGAWPFYRSAWAALRTGRISIDLPISLAFIGGFAESLRQTLHHTNLLYLDSLTSLVFLMLASRYALARLERAETSKSGILHALLPARATRWRAASDGSLVPARVRADALETGDLVSIDAGTSVPADARVESGEAWIDLSFLTGESRAVHVRAGDAVYAGSRVVDGSARARVESRGSDTRLGRLQSRLETAAPRRNARVERSDRWAVLFLASVIGFAALLLALYGAEHPAEAFRRSLSLLIIACPCALALATPLAVARAHRAAASIGILLRDSDVLDRLAEIGEVVFDKTGTLTVGRPVVRSWRWLVDGELSFHESVLYSLEERARHPYGKAIAKALENRAGVERLPVSDFREIAGEGVRARVAGSEWSAGRAGEGESSTVVFRRDGAAIAEIALEDAHRPEAKCVVHALRERGLAVGILSGDAPEAVERAAHEAGVRFREARLSPEQKRERIEKIGASRKTLMIGDGVNDALALRAATIGVAMSRGEGSSVETALAVSDVAILRPDLRALDDLFEIARRYRRTLTRNAIVSAIYNLVGASFAAAGLVHPLVGAVAMPVSALTVYLSTVRGIRAPKRRPEVA